MSFNIIGSPKTFADVRVGEKVFIIDPKDTSIKPVTVWKSAQHPGSKNGVVWVLEVYIPFRLDSIKEESLKEAKEFGTRVTQQFFVQSKEHIVMLVTKVPTMLATEEKYLTLWMEKNKLGLILPRRSV